MTIELRTRIANATSIRELEHIREKAMAQAVEDDDMEKFSAYEKAIFERKAEIHRGEIDYNRLYPGKNYWI